MGAMHMLVGRSEQNAMAVSFQGSVNFAGEIESTSQRRVRSNNIRQKLFVRPQKLPVFDLTRLTKVLHHAAQHGVAAVPDGLGHNRAISLFGREL